MAIDEERKLALSYALEYHRDIQSDVDTVLGTAAKFRNFLAGQPEPEERRGWDDVPRIR